MKDLVIIPKYINIVNITPWLFGNFSISMNKKLYCMENDLQEREKNHSFNA